MLEWCLLCKWLSRSIDQEKTFFLWSSYRWEGILIFRASVGFCQMVWRSGLVLFCLSAAYCFILLFLLAVYLTYSFEIKSTATKDHSPYVSFPGLMCMITFSQKVFLFVESLEEGIHIISILLGITYCFPKCLEKFPLSSVGKEPFYSSIQLHSVWTLSFCLVMGYS